MHLLLTAALAAPPTGACDRALARGAAVLQVLAPDDVLRLAPTLGRPGERTDDGVVFADRRRRTTVTWHAAPGPERCGRDGRAHTFASGGRALTVVGHRAAEAFDYVLDEAVGALPLPEGTPPPPGPDTIEVDGRWFVLDPPPRHGPLPPGHALEGVPLTDHALRGAIADVVLDLPGPGTWQLAVDPASVQVHPAVVTSVTADRPIVRLHSATAATATVRLLPAPPR